MKSAWARGARDGPPPPPARASETRGPEGRKRAPRGTRHRPGQRACPGPGARGTARVKPLPTRTAAGAGTRGASVSPSALPGSCDAAPRTPPGTRAPPRAPRAGVRRGGAALPPPGTGLAVGRGLLLAPPRAPRTPSRRAHPLSRRRPARVTPAGSPGPPRRRRPRPARAGPPRGLRQAPPPRAGRRESGSEASASAAPRLASAGVALTRKSPSAFDEPTGRLRGAGGAGGSGSGDEGCLARSGRLGRAPLSCFPSQSLKAGGGGAEEARSRVSRPGSPRIMGGSLWRKSR